MTEAVWDDRSVLGAPAGSDTAPGAGTVPDADTAPDHGESRWFGVRTVYRHDLDDGTGRYEERVVTVRAPDFTVAVERAEAEAGEYAEACACA